MYTQKYNFDYDYTIIIHKDLESREETDEVHKNNEYKIFPKRENRGNLHKLQFISVLKPSNKPFQYVIGNLKKKN